MNATLSGSRTVVKHANFPLFGRSRGDELLEKGMSKGNLTPIVSSRSEGNNVGGGALPPTSASAIVPLLGPLDGGKSHNFLINTVLLWVCTN